MTFPDFILETLRKYGEASTALLWGETAILRLGKCEVENIPTSEGRLVELLRSLEREKLIRHEGGKWHAVYAEERPVVRETQRSLWA